MARRMTIVFDDEELYTALKVHAARTHRPAKDIVADALMVLFEAPADDYEAILDRARTSASARRGSPAVFEVLRELGLGKERAEANRS